MTEHLEVGDERVCLAYVRVGGNDDLRHVSEFAELEPRQRPKPTCPVCSRTVVLRLGEVRAHHAAHRKGAICRTTNPEYALYFNSKVHIGKALEGASKLSVGVKCRNKHCFRRRSVDWVADWDRVMIETEAGSTKPDVTLYRGDSAVASIDVAVSRTLDVDKGAARKLHPIPWVVVRTSKNLYRRVLAWTPASVLEVEAGVIVDGECSECVEERELAAKQRLERKRRREEKRKRKRKPQVRLKLRRVPVPELSEGEQSDVSGMRVEARHFRVVDFYYPDGRYDREVFSTSVVTQEGVILEMLLKSNWSEVARIPWTDEASTMRALTAAFVTHVDGRGAGVIADRRTKWCEAENGSFPEAAKTASRGSLSWDWKTETWRER